MLNRAKKLTLGAAAFGLALGIGADPAAAQLTFSGGAAGGFGGGGSSLHPAATSSTERQIR